VVTPSMTVPTDCDIVAFMERLSTSSGAIFDRGRRYRYVLWRNFSERAHQNYLSIIMLNPSNADEHFDDPTIASCGRLARNNGYDGFMVSNLYAYCTPYPAELMACRDPVGALWGRQNDHYLQLTQSSARATLLAWGNHAVFKPGRVSQVLAMVDKSRALHIGMTGKMQPRHPLYVAADARLLKAPAILWA
jgi:hypothetical protein